MENPAQPIPPVQPAEAQPTQTPQPKPRSKLPIILGILVSLLILASAAVWVMGSRNKTPQAAVQPTTTQMQRYASQKECEEKTGKKCLLNMCQVAQGSPVTNDCKPGWYTNPNPSPTSTIDPTANWKTYTNTKYGYTLMYPQEWQILTPGLSDATTSSLPTINSPCELTTELVCSQIVVNINEKLEAPNTISNKTNTKLDNKDATAFQISQPNVNGNGMLRYAVETKQNNYTYTITYSETQKDGHFITDMNDWKNKKIFDQILSTFKFTPPAGGQNQITSSPSASQCQPQGDCMNGQQCPTNTKCTPYYTQMKCLPVGCPGLR